MMRLGEEGVRQGAEERSSLLSKLLFSRQTNKRYIYNSTCKRFFFALTGIKGAARDQ